MEGLTPRMVSDFQSETVFLVNQHITSTDCQTCLFSTANLSGNSSSELELKRKMALNFKKNGSYQSSLGRVGAQHALKTVFLVNYKLIQVAKKKTSSFVQTGTLQSFFTATVGFWGLLLGHLAAKIVKASQNGVYLILEKMSLK